VGRVFRAQQLVWTVNDALCVLADAEPERASAPHTPLPSWVEGGGYGDYKRPRLPRLTTRAAAAQLTLFD
jgi:hypothetical protein